MNDLESKLRTLSFREPPPGLRASVLAAAQPGGWRSWMAPHPAAWAALAALWIALAIADAVVNGHESPEGGNLAALSVAPEPPALIAFYRHSGALDPSF